MWSPREATATTTSPPPLHRIDTDRGTKTLEGRISLDQKTGVQSLDSSTGFFVPTRNISKINNGNVNEDAVITAQKDVISRIEINTNRIFDIINLLVVKVNLPATVKL